MSHLEQFRAQKDDFFRHDWQSPLTPDQRQEFTGLKYYPENAALRLTLPIEPYADQETVTMITSTGSAREYVKYGQFSFEVNGEIATLQVYQDPEGEYFFLPFVDATAPDETYGAGRYLDIEPIGNGEFLIDFNTAYNPYCAYSEPYEINPNAVQRWSCPLPPRENYLKVRIEAGEKKYYEDH
jgi:uncharacterized protein (DUF1684 family)